MKRRLPGLRRLERLLIYVTPSIIHASNKRTRALGCTPSSLIAPLECLPTYRPLLVPRRLVPNLGHDAKKERAKLPLLPTSAVIDERQRRDHLALCSTRRRGCLP